MKMLPALFVCLLSVPQAYQTVEIVSSYDGTTQPLLLALPSSTGPVPLVVCLHSWSGMYAEMGYPVNLASGTFGMAAVAPNFRGANDDPEACMSPAAQQDILDAVDFMTASYSINTERIYLYGSSGGGHAGLMMAARYPERWAAVSTWVAISDLAAWYWDYPETHSRHDSLEAVCGGPPEEEYLAEYESRSAINCLNGAVGLWLELNSGIHDRVVLPYQQIRAFNAVAAAGGFLSAVVSEEDIEFILENGSIPSGLVSEPLEARSKTTLFHRTAGRCRLIVFDGGHETVPADSFQWLSQFPQETELSDWTLF